jgi:hypothetical protein
VVLLRRVAALVPEVKMSGTGRRSTCCSTVDMITMPSRARSQSDQSHFIRERWGGTQCHTREMRDW